MLKVWGGGFVDGGFKVAFGVAVEGIVKEEGGEEETALVFALFGIESADVVDGFGVCELDEVDEFLGLFHFG